MEKFLKKVKDSKFFLSMTKELRDKEGDFDFGMMTEKFNKLKPEESEFTLHLDMVEHIREVLNGPAPPTSFAEARRKIGAFVADLMNSIIYLSELGAMSVGSSNYLYTEMKALISIKDENVEFDKKAFHEYIEDIINQILKTIRK